MVFPFLLALLLGLKHSYDADHILAVSNLLYKTKSFRNVVKMSLSWSIGHMLTASIVTLILFYFRGYLATNFLSYFQYAVATMLIILGVFTLANFKFLHFHKHKHNNKEHSHAHTHTSISKEKHYHKHMFGIGVIQGLASNDELLTLFVVSLTLTTLPAILTGVFLFSIGVVIGMLVYSISLNYSITRFGDEKMSKVVKFGSGGLSIGYGALMVFGVV